MTKKYVTHEGVMAAAHLQEIRDRCEKATPGPWVTDAEESIKVRAPHGGYVSMIGWLKGKHGEKGRIAADEGADNAHFIAAARSDVPALLDHIAAQDAEIAQLREALDEIRGSVIEIQPGSHDTNIRIDEIFGCHMRIKRALRKIGMYSKEDANGKAE